jgi:hypothetical protein
MQNITIKQTLIFASIAFLLLSVATVLLTPSIQAAYYPLEEDQGAAWYYWKLPNDGNTAARISYWTGYIVHQLVVWGMIIGLRKKKKEMMAAKGVHIRNLLLLGVNLLFVGLHLVQTYFWYDGLAQDVPVWSSQGSVIVMLVIVLLMEIPRRGLFMGRIKKIPASLKETLNVIHGPIISWALVYTFWFHPMEGNWGMMTGFIYMFLLFIQLSMVNTPVHFNKSWIVLLEVFVAIHGTLITVYKSNPIWPMFLYGFLFMFVFTQQYSWKLKSWMRWAIYGTFFISFTLVYGYIRGFNHFYELSFIPVALYGGAFGTILLFALGEAGYNKLRKV